MEGQTLVTGPVFLDCPALGCKELQQPALQPPELLCPGLVAGCRVHHGCSLVLIRFSFLCPASVYENSVCLLSSLNTHTGICERHAEWLTRLRSHLMLLCCVSFTGYYFNNC